MVCQGTISSEVEAQHQAGRICGAIHSVRSKAPNRHRWDLLCSSAAQRHAVEARRGCVACLVVPLDQATATQTKKNVLDLLFLLCFGENTIYRSTGKIQGVFFLAWKYVPKLARAEQGNVALFRFIKKYYSFSLFTIHTIPLSHRTQFLRFGYNVFSPIFNGS